MITKTEVNEALHRTEAHTGWSALDRTPVSIAAGDLFLLREAAKVAWFRERIITNSTSKSNSDLILTDR